MAQKEDILEQIVEEYLVHEGYFVQRNIKYRPNARDPDYVSQQDSVRSDIDVLALHPRKGGADRVLAFNIKSYQGGFNCGYVISKIESQHLPNAHRLKFRELCVPKWSKAFMSEIEERTGQKEFTHVLAVTFAKGETRSWIQHERFRESLPTANFRVVQLREMIDKIEPKLTTTPAATDIGRTLQLFRAAGLRPKPTERIG